MELYGDFPRALNSMEIYGNVWKAEGNRGDNGTLHKMVWGYPRVEALEAQVSDD